LIKLNIVKKERWVWAIILSPHTHTNLISQLLSSPESASEWFQEKKIKFGFMVGLRLSP
jgi:hypothetical protein